MLLWLYLMCYPLWPRFCLRPSSKSLRASHVTKFNKHSPHLVFLLGVSTFGWFDHSILERLNHLYVILFSHVLPFPTIESLAQLNSHLHLSLRFHYKIIFISMPLKGIYIVMLHTFISPAQILPLNFSHMYTVDYLIPPFATHLPSPGSRPVYKRLPRGTAQL